MAVQADFTVLGYWEYYPHIFAEAKFIAKSLIL